MTSVASALRVGFFLGVFAVGPTASAGATPVTIDAFAEGVDRYLVADRHGAPLEGGRMGADLAGDTRLGLAMFALRDRYASRDAGGDVEMELGYGGVSVTQQLLSHAWIDLAFDVTAGGGMRCQRGVVPSSDGCVSADGFAIVEPGLELAMQPAGWLTVGVWLGYRFVVTADGLESATRTPSDDQPTTGDLGGLAASVTVDIRL